MVQVNGIERIDKTGQLIASWQERLDKLNAAVGVAKQWHERYHATLVGNFGGVGFTSEQADTVAVDTLYALAPHRGAGGDGGEAGKVYSYVYWYTSLSSDGYPVLHAQSAAVFVRESDGVRVYPQQHGGWGPAILEAIKEAQSRATFYAKVIAKSDVLTGQDETIGNLRAEAFTFLLDYKGAYPEDMGADLADAWPNLFGGRYSCCEEEDDDE